MIKAVIKQVVSVGYSPGVLIGQVAALRAIGLLPRPQMAATRTPEQILIAFPYHSVGDLILALTLVDQVHELWPDASIDVAVGVSMGPLVKAIPHVRLVFMLPRPQVSGLRPVAYTEISNITRLYREEIASTIYDLAIAPRWDSVDSFYGGYLSYLTGARVRCGYSGTNDGGTTEVDRFFTVAAKSSVPEPESLRYTRLLSRCGVVPADADDANRPFRPIAALQAIRNARRDAGVNQGSPVSGPYAILSPGATKAWHQWPLTRFAEVGNALHERYGLRSLVIGSSQDVPLCAELCQLIGAPAVSIAGKTDALQMLDLIAAAGVFIGNDSGPGHIAGGLSVPTVIVSPHTREAPAEHRHWPIGWRPTGDKVRLVQPVASAAPCAGVCEQDQPHCILNIPAREVMLAVESVCGSMLDQLV